MPSVNIHRKGHLAFQQFFFIRITFPFFNNSTWSKTEMLAFCSNGSGITYLLLFAFCKAPPLSEHKQQFCKER